MNPWVFAVFAFTLILGVFVFLSVKGWTWRLVAAAVFVALVATVFGGTFELLGLPKDVRYEWRKLAGSEILAFDLDDGVAIYIWINRDGERISYKLPWSIEQAQHLQDGGKKIGEEGGTMVATQAIDGRQDDKQGGVISEVKPPSENPPKQ